MLIRAHAHSGGGRQGHGIHRWAVPGVLMAVEASQMLLQTAASRGTSPGGNGPGSCVSRKTKLVRLPSCKAVTCTYSQPGGNCHLVRDHSGGILSATSGTLLGFAVASGLCASSLDSKLQSSLIPPWGSYWFCRLGQFLGTHTVFETVGTLVRVGTLSCP